MLSITFYKKSNKDKKEYLEYDLIGRAKIDGNSYYILYLPKMIAETNLRIAAVATLESSYSNNNEYIVAVDDLFIKMPDSLREFVIAHEVGHIVLGHTAKNEGRSIEKELAADKFAISSVSDEGLRLLIMWMMFHMDKKSSYYNTTIANEYKERLDHLCKIVDKAKRILVCLQKDLDLK